MINAAKLQKTKKNPPKKQKAQAFACAFLSGGT
jgi:hypothetical protein